MFLFTDDCILGVDAIDNEHRHLFDILNNAMDMLQDEYTADHYSDIKILLEELEDYADQHFTHEEKYMEEICDPELILQRPQHMYFREKIMDFLLVNIDDEEEQRDTLKEIVNFLARWLYRHIIGSDSMIGKLPPLEEWMVQENPCEFTDKYLTGISHIDREHKGLFEIIERANRMVGNWNGDESYDKFMDILDELKDYTAFHFADEEEYMKSIGYKGYEVQKRAHDAFIARINELEETEIDEDPQRYLQSLVQFLLGWLINHILHEDKKIGVALGGASEEN